MPDLAELLEDLAGSPAGVDIDAVRERVAQRRRRRRALRLASVALFVVIASGTIAFVLSTDNENSPQEVDVVGPGDPEADDSESGSPRGVFSQPTGVVLVADDGLQGVQVIDLDRRVLVRRGVEGQLAGDQPYRLTRIGDELIVGWGEVYAFDLQTTESRLLGEATIYLPAAEPDRLWLIEWSEGRIGQGDAVYRLIDADGTVVLEVPEPAGRSYPASGIPDGLVFQRSTGIELWDAKQGQITHQFGGDSGFVADVSGDLIAWGEGQNLHISSTEGQDRVIPPPAHTDAFDAQSARFSPDGTKLAVGAYREISPSQYEATLALIDTVTGDTETIIGALPARALLSGASTDFLSWSPDGSQVFFSSNSYGSSETTVGRLVVGEDRIETTTLPFGEMMNTVILDRAEAAALLDVDLTSPEECPPYLEGPPPPPCGFNF